MATRCPLICTKKRIRSQDDDRRAPHSTQTPTDIAGETKRKTDKKKTTTKLLTNKIGRIIKAIAKQDTNIIQQQKTKNINTKNVFEIHLNHLRETVTFDKKNKKQNTKQK